MALVVKDRVKQTTTTTGTGSIVLNGNIDGFQTFAAALANGDTTYYGIFVPSTNAFEVGLGTWTEGSATLARTTILESSNSGSAINITAQAEVFITQPAEKAVFQDANGDVDLGGNKILFGNLYSSTGDLPSASTYHGMFAHVHGTGKAYYAHGGNWIELVNEDTSGNVSMGGNLTVTGDLTVNGTTTTVSTTNTVVKDSLIELGNGTSGSPSNDAGIVIERGSSDNAFIGYDESADKFTVGTGSFTGATTGNLTISTGTLVANVEGNVTGNVTGNADTATTAATVTTAAQPNITSLGTLTTLTVDDITINGSTISDAGDLTVDVGGNIVLDADGGGIFFKDAGTTIGILQSDSGDFKISSSVSDKDIVFRGNDGGSSIEAMRIDMSAGGYIGIGTASPNWLFTVKGTVGFEATNSTNNYAVYTHTDNTFRINYNGSGNDEVVLDSSGNVTITGSLTVDDITINGSTISDGGDLTIDAAGEIILDADGGDIIFKDGGTQFGVIFQSSNHMYIQSSISNGDIIFRGNDDGTAGTQALKLDMSDAGSAVFNNHIYVSDNSKVVFGAASDLEIYHDTSNSYISDTGTGDLNITSNSGLILDSAGNIHLDADGGYITFKDAGTQFGTVVNSSTNAEFLGTLNIHLRPNNGSSATSNYIWNQGHVTPWVNTYFDLGNSSYGWKDLYLTDKIYHQGDTDTYISFGTNTVQTVAGGNGTWSVYSSYVAVQGYMYNYYTYYDESTQLTGTTPTINTAESGNFYLTMSGNTTFTFTNAQTGGSWACGFTLYLTGNGSTVTWPNSVKWAGGSAPDAPANGEVDVLVFHTRDGSNWYGVLASDAAS